MRAIIISISLLISLLSQAQDLSKFPSNHALITNDSFCALFHANQVWSLMESMTYNNNEHDYANRLSIARLWNTVMINGDFIESYEEIICSEFSMDTGVWRRFYYYVDDFWADDSLYFKDGELYVLNEMGQEEFPFYRLKKTKAVQKEEKRAREKALEEQKKWAAYRKDKILELPYDSLPKLTTILLEEWLGRYFERHSSIRSFEIQDFITKEIKEITTTELLQSIQKMKKKEQLIIRYINTNLFDPITFDIERTGPIIIEIIP
ncbi:MAG: hypothetical protein ACRBFS_07650 [Aureispira sp.]